MHTRDWSATHDLPGTVNPCAFLCVPQWVLILTETMKAFSDEGTQQIRYLIEDIM